MKRIFTLFLLTLGFISKLDAQVLTNACESLSPCNARPICGTGTLNVPQTYTYNAGATALYPACLNNNGVTSAFGAGAQSNWVYFRFRVYTAGNLVLTIAPNDGSSDLDWALFNITTTGCSSLGVANLVECNTNGLVGAANNNGQTGINNAGVPAANFEPTLPIAVGEYILAISRFSGGLITQGFSLNFTGTTASLTDATPPTMQSILPINVCNPVTSIKVKLNEGVLCSSVAASDFSVNNGAPAFTVATGANCPGCTTPTYPGPNYSNTSDTVTLNFASALAPGNYTVSLNANGVQDICGNNSTASTLTFTVPQPLTANITEGMNCGTGQYNITVQGVNGTAPYRYAAVGTNIPSPGVYGGQTSGSNSYSSVVGGSPYLFMVQDDQGCIDTTSITFTPYAANWSVLFNPPPVSPPCNNQFMLDTIKTSANAVGPSITYAIAGPNAATSNPGLSSPNGVWSNLVFPGATGSYTVTVTDNFGCTKTGVAVLSNPNPVSLSISNPPAQCFNSCNGTFNLTPGGGTFPYTYTVLPTTPTVPCAPVITVNSVSNLYATTPPVTYTVTLSDSKGCTISATRTILANSPVVQNLNNVVHPTSCANLCVGTLTPTATGGSGTKRHYRLPLVVGNTYTDSVTTAGGQFTGLCPGTYTVITRDAQGCTVMGTFVINFPALPDLTFDDTTSVACFGQCTGQIFTTTTGGTLPYVYTLSPNPNAPCGNATLFGTGDYQNLPAGTYKVVVRGANQCKDSVENIVIVQPPSALSWQALTINNVTCFDSCNGSITAPATGGTGTILYTIAPSGAPCPPLQSGNSFTQLGANINYTITATDANNCTLTTVVNLSQPPQLIVSRNQTANITCFGLCNAAVQVSSVGGTGSISYQISPNTNGACNATLTGNTFSGLWSATYTITATDQNNCTATTTININQPPALNISAAVDSNVRCFGVCDGGATGSASGGFGALTYSIAGPGSPLINASTGVATNLCVGIYTINVVDANACSNNSTVQITQPNQLLINMVGTTDPSCGGYCDGQAAVNNNGGGTGAISYQITPSSNGTCSASQAVAGVFTGLWADSYTITATDQNGCTATATFTLTQPTPVGVTIPSLTNINCFGQCTGSITALGNGGTAPYTYSISPNSTPPCLPIQAANSFSNLGANINYTISVSDLNGCIKDTAVMLSQPANPLGLTITNTDSVVCSGQCNGVANIIANDGTAPYSYTIAPNAGPCIPQQLTPGNFTGLASGTYTVTCTDFASCTLTTTFTINEPLPLVTNYILTNPLTCVPGCDAEVTMSSIGGNGAYVYSILPAGPIVTGNVISGICANTVYTITSTDSKACEATITVQLSSPPNPIVTVASTTNSSCASVCDGSVTLNPSNLTYTISPAAGAPVGNVIGGLCSGTVYTVSGVDGNGCVGTTTVNINANPDPVIDTISVVKASCVPGCDGIVTMTPANFTYSITPAVVPPIVGNQLSGLCAGTSYTITGTAASGCTATYVISIGTQNAPVVTVASTTNASCASVCDGSVTLNPSNLTYTISPAAGAPVGNVIGGLCSGTVYTVSGVDGNGCVGTTTVNINANPDPVIDTISTVKASCLPGCDGIVTMTPANFTYSITPAVVPPIVGNQLSGLCAGTSYTITGTAASGCTATYVISIGTQNAPVVTVASTTNASCASVCDGSVTLNPSNLTYTISPAAGTPAGNVIGGLCSGTVYTVSGVDGNGCVGTTTVNINANPDPVIDTISVVKASCVPGCDGIVTMTPANFTYSITPAVVPPIVGNQLSGLCAGTSYTITGTAASGCTATYVISIGTQNAPVVTVASTTNASCASVCDGSVTLNPSNLTYTISPAAGTPAGNVIGGLCSGTNYVVTGTDANGCPGTTLVNINANPDPVLDTISTVKASCLPGCDGIVTMTPANFTYSITPAVVPPIVGNQLSGLCAGTSYTITGTAASGCTATYVINDIGTANGPVVTIASTTNASCASVCDGSVTLNPSNLTYTISPAAGTPAGNVIGGLCSGTNYVVTGTDANGCPGTTLVNINANPDPVLDTISTVKASCLPGCDGIVTMTPANFTYSITPAVVPPIVGNQLSGLCAGTSYTITGTAASGCTATYVINDIGTANGPVVTIASTTNASCASVCDGSVTLNPSNLTYTISPAAGTPAGNVIGGLCSGTNYVVTGTDANGCPGTTLVNINANPDPVLDTISTVKASCVPGCDGIVLMTPANFTYSITPAVVPPIVGNQLSGLCAGTSYTITGTAASGCTATYVISIGTQNAPVVTVASTTNASCASVCDGSVTLNPSNLTYTISPAAGTPAGNVIGGLCSGTNYVVTGTDANGCPGTTLVNINANPDPVLDTISTVKASCVPGCDGIVTMTPANFTYSITPAVVPPIVGNQLSGLCAGTSYTITGTAASGCTATYVINDIGTANGPVVTIASTTNASCASVCDGSVTLNPSNLTYTISPAGGAPVGNVIGGLCSGTNYVVTGTDANGCPGTTLVNINANPDPVLDTISTVKASCVPGCDGIVLMTPANFTYSITPAVVPPIVGNQLSGLCAGTSYTITGTAASGCTATYVINDIGTANGPVVTIASTTNASCASVCDGSVTLNPSNLTYTISPAGGAPVGNVIGGLCSGTNYVVTGTDANGCPGTTLVNINANPDPVLDTISTVKASCLPGCDGIVTMTPANFTYSITPAVVPPIVGNQLSGLCAGTSYTITGTAASGCTATYSITIGTVNGPSASVVSTTPAGCNPGCDGTAQVSGSGGTGAYTYTIAAPLGTIPAPAINAATGLASSLCAGVVYTITVTDIAGCSSQTTVQVGTSLNPTVSITAQTNPTAAGSTNGTITALGAGGTPNYTYTINPQGPATNGTGVFNGLSALATPDSTCFVITVTDSKGCTATTTTCLKSPGVLTINAVATNVTCFGLNNGIVTASVSGGAGSYSYTLNGGASQTSPVFSNLTPGIYTVQVTDANNNTATSTATVTQPNPIQFGQTVTTNPTCVPGCDASITVSASGGTGAITYSIANALIPCPITQPSPGVFDGAGLATYTITAADVNGCTATTTTTIVPGPTPTLTFVSKTDAICFGSNTGQIIVTGSGGNPNYTYSISPSVQTSNTTGVFANIPANNYTITLTDAAGCTSVISNITVIQPNAITFNPPNVQNVACYGDATGTITVTSLGGNGGYTYSINPALNPPTSTGFFINLPAGAYVITSTDVQGCTATTVAIITQNPQLLIDSLHLTEPICNGDANGIIEIFASGGVSPIQYALDGTAFQTSRVFNAVEAGVHLVSLKDILGCTKDTNIILTEPLPVGADLLIKHTSCIDSKDGSLIATGTGGRGGYKYYITPGLYINKSGIFTGLAANTYTLRVVDTAGCEYTTLFTINKTSNPINIAVSKQDLGCTGRGNEGQATAIIGGGTPPYTYVWSTIPAQTTPTASGLYFGTYFVDVVDSKGCTIRDTVEIEEGPCCDIAFIPNAFSPNGDGNNDEFRVLTTAGVQLLQLEVRNRWGNRIWATNDYRKGWDGMYEGRIADQETYFYVLRYRCTIDNKEYVKKGDVLLVR